MKPSLALIGPGRVGCAVTRRLHQAGHPITAVIGRIQSAAAEACEFIGCSASLADTDLGATSSADIVLLAVPDDRLLTIGTDLCTTTEACHDQIMVQFSGLHPADVLPTARGLSIHPLLPFADRETAVQHLSGCPCALEGTESLLPLGEDLINSLGGKSFRIQSEQKALYHTAACIASNFLVSLLDEAAGLIKQCGISENEELPLLLPLVRSTIANLDQYGTEQGLTGPIVRGDLSTVTAHLTALQQKPKQLELYRLLADRTLDLAKRSGRLKSTQYASIRNLLNGQLD